MSRLEVVYPKLYSCLAILLFSERPDSVQLCGSNGHWSSCPGCVFCGNTPTQSRAIVETPLGKCTFDSVVILTKGSQDWDDFKSIYWIAFNWDFNLYCEWNIAT